MITQHQLAWFHALRSHQEKIQFRLQQMRAALLKQVDAGDAIEEGDLTLEATYKEKQIISVAKLEELLGKESAKAIRDAVTPTAQIWLQIRERKGSKSDYQIKDLECHNLVGFGSGQDDPYYEHMFLNEAVE